MVVGTRNEFFLLERIGDDFFYIFSDWSRRTAVFEMCCQSGRLSELSRTILAGDWTQNYIDEMVKHLLVHASL